MIGIFLTSLVFIACAILLWNIADKRGANTLFWAVMGGVFGPLAIPFVFLTKNNNSETNQSDNS